MKSRFTNFNSVTDCPHASSPILARSTKEVAPISAARRFELRYNASPRFARRRQERRQGQALLLAVLIMLLAALLSAGFLAVLSGNLNQTARIADKTRAIEASRTGVAYANAQLSTSSQGDLWRPIDVSPALTPNDPGYNFYYSQLDKVQGWANTMTPPNNPTLATFERDKYFFRNDVYGKFPAPNQALGDAPKFLLKVEDLPVDPDADFYNPTLNPGHPYDAQHAGEIKITSIGLSDDDPNVFHKTIAYKTGRRKSPWASALRSISNWDFKARNNQGGVPFSAVADQVLNPTPMANLPVPITDTTAFSNDDVPFNVVIVKKAGPTNSLVRGAVVTQVTPPANSAPPGTRTILTLARVDGPIGTDEFIQKAAAIGTGSSIDLLNVGTLPTGAPATLLDFPLQNQPNGILANGSVWLQNQIQLSNLRKYGTKLFASGSFAIDNAVTATQKATVLENSGDIGPTNTLDPNSNRIVPSSQPTFPGDIVLTAAASSNGVDKTDLIRDGWNNIRTQTLGLDYSLSRDVEPFKPAKIDSAENLARYRALTRNSGVDSNGNRLGVYIDNRDDVEKVGTAPMTQRQFMEMLTSDGTTSAFDRNGTAGGASLEEKHLRGWVGPDEFLARGALVELLQLNNGTPYIRVTYDNRSDATPGGLDQTKAIRGADGNPQAGVYTQEYSWPKNGTLLAEGNIRIRGSVKLPVPPTDGSADAFPSLTVVSLGNIYIEGSVSVDNSIVVVGGNTVPAPNRKKLMLLAKKNVVVNPTRLVLGHVDAQTISMGAVNIAPGVNSDLQVNVSDGSDFRPGDKINIGTNMAFVTAVNSRTQIEIKISNPLPTVVVIPANSPVRLAQWKDDYTQATPYFKADKDNSVVRRVLLQNAATAYPNLRLSLDHVAQRKEVFKVETEAFGVDPDTGAAYTKPDGLKVGVTNKRVAVGAMFDIRNPIIRSADKRINAAYNKFTAGIDTFPNATAYPFTDTTINGGATLPNGEVQARTFSLANLEAEVNALPGRQDDTLKKGWKYKATNSATPPEVPFFYLAAIGLRDEASLPDVTTADGVDIGTKAFNIPLATSVRLQRNAIIQSLTAPYNADDGMGGSVLKNYTVPYLGFNPLYGVVANPGDPNAIEDVLSSDQSFYQTDANILRSVLDSRSPSAPFATSDELILRQNTDLLTATDTLPEYRVRALKLENTNFGTPQDPAVVAPAPLVKPVDLQIDAFVYAQEGSWFVIPGDYFRPKNPVRSNVDGTASYIDFNNNGVPDAGEYVNGTNNGNNTASFDAGDFADLNRNGIADPGEAEAALRLVRYNYKVNFFGAIVENQTAVVADVKLANAQRTDPPIVAGAVQDWTNKWAAYDSTLPFFDVRNPNIKDKFRFISYAFDPSVAVGSPGANELRVPVTDDLIYEQ